ncbi:unnamed protein product [Boreogadus saida]
MRRSNASVADPYRRDWEPRDPLSSGLGYHPVLVPGPGPGPDPVLTAVPDPQKTANVRSAPARLVRPQAPEVQRSNDPDFALKNRLILAAIKATHHLANVTGPEPLPVIARLVASLMASIRPAVAASWAARQYRHRLRQETLDSLRSELRQELDTRAPLDALRDGSLPPSCLPPPAELLLDLRLPAPDPGTLDRDGRADRSPSRTSSVSLFSFPSYPPPPLLPPADSRPPPAAPPSQMTTRTPTKPRRRTIATPGSVQTSARWDAVPAGTSLGSARPSPALPRPRRKPRPAVSSLVQPLTTPLPTTSASGSTHAFFQPPRLIFAPPADGVTPDTPTRRPTRHTKVLGTSPFLFSTTRPGRKVAEKSKKRSRRLTIAKLGIS